MEPWILVNLGHVLKWKPDPEPNVAEALYRQALTWFQERGNLEGELRVRDTLWSYLLTVGRTEAATTQLAASRAALRPDSAPRHRARVLIMEARHLFQQKKNLSEALRLAEEARELLRQDKHYQLELKCLRITASLHNALGQPRKSFHTYMAEAETARLNGDVQLEPWALIDGLIALQDDLAHAPPRPEERARVLDLAKEIVAKAEVTNQIQPSARAWYYVGLMSDGNEAATAFQRCAQLARQAEDFEAHRTCRLAWASHLARDKPEEALNLARATWEQEPPVEDLRDNLLRHNNDLLFYWSAGSYREKFEAANRAFDAIEQFRDSQLTPADRLATFTNWVTVYPWVAGRLLLRYEKEGQVDSLARAFEVMERKRSRLLLDFLDTSSARTTDGPEVSDVRKERTEVLRKIARLQRQLRTRQLIGKESVEALQRIEELEKEEERLQDRFFQLNPLFQDLEDPEFATIGQVQENLAPHEALLSFQLALWEGIFEDFPGGSWVVVVTRDEVRVHRLPDSYEVEARIDLLTGYLGQGRDDPALARRLYQDLLAEALEGLPEQVRHLILIPDGALHRLPFSALQDGEGGPPLGARYRLSRAPSATLWLRWRRDEPRQRPPRALVLAAPPGVEGIQALKDGTEPETPEGASRNGAPPGATHDPFPLFEPLGPLPFARNEGWSIRRHLGSGTALLLGNDASERWLKESSLHPYSLVHFAAHATPGGPGPDHVDRSGVFLAGGAEDEDGWLQYREIVELDFDDQAVVLSTCHGARGSLVHGEGVLDLARSFFQAGARSVVASLWRLDDRRAAAFFDRFYHHLARGDSLAGALHRTRAEQIAAGVPASAWAGIVLVGDGSLVPIPEREGHSPLLPLAAALLLLLLGTGVAAGRR